MPSLAEAERVGQRLRGDDEELEEYLCRLVLTLQRASLADLQAHWEQYGGDGEARPTPNTAAEGRPAPHDLTALWHFVHNEFRRLDEKRRPPALVLLQRAAAEHPPATLNSMRDLYKWGTEVLPHNKSGDNYTEKGIERILTRAGYYEPGKHQGKARAEEAKAVLRRLAADATR